MCRRNNVPSERLCFESGWPIYSDGVTLRLEQAGGISTRDLDLADSAMAALL
jgi:hypothetical protein